MLLRPVQLIEAQPNFGCAGQVPLVCCDVVDSSTRGFPSLTLTGRPRGFLQRTEVFLTLNDTLERSRRVRQVVEVDAARLLLLLATFAREITDDLRTQVWFPRDPVKQHFTPEYHLQKLDFLLRYPAYLAYELVELYRDPGDLKLERDEIMHLVRSIMLEREPEFETRPFIRFRYGAYEPLDRVEAWWTSRKLVYVRTEPRTDSRPQKYYFLTERALDAAQRLPEEVAAARWYAERAQLLQRYFGHFSPATLKNRQYTHETYRTARPGLFIPDLSISAIEAHFTTVFHESLEVGVD